MRYDTIEVSKQNGTVIVSLNRPEVHNAMNESLMTELTNCFKELSNDNTVRTIVLTGKGKSFCAGADLNWMKSMVSYSKEENIKDSRLLLDLYETIYSCPKPVIGRINGHAFGGGLGLIAVCDITISVPGLKFAFSEANLGIIPSVISTYVSPRVTPADMRRLFITGERFGSTVARDIGLIDFVVTPEEFDSKVEYYIEQSRSSGPIAMKEVKNLIKNLQEMHIDKYKEFTVEKISELRVSEEGQEGINAFLEKRKPKWRE
ncbi:MAG: enoyl-CoA hydratase/isomerase family protein [Thermoplasmatales archaeon]|nr:enoyl-CoA hydratase/isomerase family protein [Thermoplasmatales archaeon]